MQHVPDTLSRPEAGETMQKKVKRVGYTCAYTPLALIDAVGLAPYRVLPLGEWPDKAGHRLHDNLCPHVKRVLDRGMEDGLPPLAGMVFMNSCDAMRRLADAWQRARPEEPVILVDLPVHKDEASVTFFRGELERLARELALWGGKEVSGTTVLESVAFRNRLSDRLATLRERHQRGMFPEGSAWLQAVYNRVSAEPAGRALAFVEGIVEEQETPEPEPGRVPVFLFGNVLPDPEVFTLFESLGARVVSEDLCTGARLFHPIKVDPVGEPLRELAQGLLARPACARTLDPSRPGRMAEEVLAEAEACGARGVIGHTVKFCDPYLARMPAVREALQKAGLPLLLLEGDCTMRSMGQHRTRIEAFIEMLR